MGVQGSVCMAAILSRSCPLWVKSRHRGTSNQRPLYPQSGHRNSTLRCLLCARSRHWPLSASFESRQVSTPPPHGQPPRSHYLRLLPSKFRRDFVIHYAGPFGVIAESSAFGPGHEEGQSRLLVGGARRGEHDAAM